MDNMEKIDANRANALADLRGKVEAMSLVLGHSIIWDNPMHYIHHSQQTAACQCCQHSVKVVVRPDDPDKPLDIIGPEPFTKCPRSR